MRNQILDRIQIAELLSKEVLGELTPEEQALLQDWKREEDNQNTYESIFDKNSYDERNRMIANINLDKEWHTYIDHINQQTKKPKAKLRTLVYVVSAAAAVILLAVGVAMFYNPGERHGKTLQTVQESVIPSGAPKAELVLASGDVVQLNVGSDDVIEEAGVKIQSNDGKISYDDKAEAIEEPVIASNTLRIPKGGEYVVELSDGTRVWLNSASELTYPVKFVGDKRTVKLKGEAYFDVTSNKEKPFIVETEDQEIVVLGTSFNVSAYTEDLNIVTTLVEGHVKVTSTMKENKGEEQFLLPSEQLILNKETSEIQKKVVNPYEFTSWKDGRFVFTNEPLDSFFKKVSRWYNVETYITDESIKDIRFTGDLPRYKDMQDMLKILEVEMSVHVEIEDNKIIYVSKSTISLSV